MKLWIGIEKADNLIIECKGKDIPFYNTTEAYKTKKELLEAISFFKDCMWIKRVDV